MSRHTTLNQSTSRQSHIELSAIRQLLNHTTTLHSRRLSGNIRSARQLFDNRIITQNCQRPNEQDSAPRDHLSSPLYGTHGASFEGTSLSQARDYHQTRSAINAYEYVCKRLNSLATILGSSGDQTEKTEETHTYMESSKHTLLLFDISHTISTCLIETEREI